MKFEVFNRFSGKVQFTAEIECDEIAPVSLRIGLAVKWAIRSGASLNGASLNGASLNGASLNGASLYGASLNGASLNGASLNGASLYGASLNGASLNGASGVNDFVKCIQIERYAIAYTATTIQIGCQRHTIEEWGGFSDAQIRAMDGKIALEWWNKYKAWIFQTIALCPATPTHGASQ